MVQSFNVSLIQKTPETSETWLLDQGRYYRAGLQKFSNHQELQRGAMHFNLTLNKSKLTTLISDTWKNFGQGYALWIIFIFYSHFQNHICGSVFIIHVLGFCNDFLTFMVQILIMHHLVESFADFSSLSLTLSITSFSSLGNSTFNIHNQFQLTW